jgi:tyrosine-protein kinase Etk/Wzc
MSADGAMAPAGAGLPGHPLRGLATAPPPLARPPAPPPPDPGALEWRTVAAQLAAQGWLIAAVALLCTLAALAYALAAPPVYEANMLIHVEEESPNASKNILNEVSSLFETKKAAIAEMELMHSRLVVAAAVDRLGLEIEAVPRYFPLGGYWLASHQPGRLSRPGLLGRGGYVWGDERIEVYRFDVPASRYGQEFALTALGGGRYRLADAAGRLLFEGDAGRSWRWNGPGGPITLGVARLDGLPGARFSLRRISRLQAVEQIQRGLRIAEQGKLSGVIEVRLEGRDPRRVHAVLSEIGAQYLRQNLARRTEEAEKALAFLDQQLPGLRQQLEKAEAAYNRFRSANHSVNLDEEVRLALQRATQLQGDQSAQRQKRRELLGKLTPEHPQVAALDAQLAATGAEIAAVEQRIRQLPLLEQEEARLAREVKVSTDLYTALLNTSQQMRLLTMGRISNVRLVDLPQAPERPIRPNRPLVVALALVTGLFLGAVLAWARGAWRAALAGPEQVESLLGGQAVHAVIAHSPVQARLRRHRPQPPLALAAPHEAAIEQLRALRATLDFTLPHSRNQVLCLAAPARRSGAGFLAVNLALLCAAAGRRVLLVDADLGSGRLHLAFGADPGHGLADVLAGVVAPQAAVRRGVAGQLDFLPRGSVRPHADLLQHGPLAAALEPLAARYDLVLLAAPPVLAGGAAMVAAAHAGIVYLVARAGRTTPAMLVASLKRLQQSGVAPQGVLVNGVRGAMPARGGSALAAC